MKKLFGRLERKTPQTYIVPTRFGFVFFGVFILMVMVGSTYQNNMVFIMAFILFSLGIIAMVQTHHNLDGLTIESAFIQSGFANTKGKVQLRARTAKRKPFVALDFEGPDFLGTSDIVEAGRINLLEGVVVYRNRGLYRTDRIKVKTIFPYGLFVAWQWHKVSADYYVYPERSGTLQMPPKNAENGEDFTGHKKFVTGHSLKHVDWKAYARGRPLLLKEFKDGSDTTHIFDIEDVAYDNVEQRLSQLSKWITDTYNGRKNFGLILGNKVISPSSGIDQFHRCLTELAKYEAS